MLQTRNDSYKLGVDIMKKGLRGLLSMDFKVNKDNDQELIQ